mgnify:FL=1
MLDNLKPKIKNGIFATGFTIMEIMVTLIIVAILTSVAMPVYNRTIDEMHKKEAKSILETLRSAELIYKIDNNEYIDAAFGSDSVGNYSRSTLNVDVHNNIDWEYGVTAAISTATARRGRGRHSNEYINMTISNGTIAEYTW